jgi:hypothetical protein
MAIEQQLENALGTAFDDMEQYLGPDDWAAFRSIAVLLGQIAGATLHHYMQQLTSSGAAVTTGAARPWALLSGATISPARVFMGMAGPDGRGHSVTGPGTLQQLAGSLSAIGAHFATPLAGVAQCAKQAAALCSDVASLFRPALEEFAAAVIAPVRC